MSAGAELSPQPAVAPDTGAARPSPKKSNAGLRRYFALEDNARFVNFVQTPKGKWVLFLLFTIPCALLYSRWFLVVIGAALCAYTERYRGYILATTTLLVLGSKTAWFGLHPLTPSVATAHVLFFAFALAYLQLAKFNPKLFVTRRPVVSLLGFISLSTGVACLQLLDDAALEIVWAFNVVFVKYVWFLAYALVDQRARNRSPLPVQIGTLHPFWGSTTVPYGKGAAYLRKTMAKSPQELAVTQIKGLKLLLWAYVLSNITLLLDWLLLDYFQLPDLDKVQAAYAAGHPYFILISWLSLIWATAKAALGLATVGHRIVAIARLAGFRFQRNTWRPLESRTLAEFWNRYYFYFKELLVEFFFLPTFLTWFKNHPRLRMFFATFMAAGVGNAVFHFVRDIRYVESMGLWGSITSFSSYLFYCAILATGIGISQARTRNNIPFVNAAVDRIWSFFCVWSFVVCLHIFGDASRVYTLSERLSFMFSLFGVG